MAVAAAAMIGGVAIARRAFGLPEHDAHPETRSSRPIAGGPIAARLRALAADHPNLSGIYPLGDPVDAFAARDRFANAAIATIDAQYYIWQGDLTGLLLLKALRDAADRGVIVRLLLDDNGIAGLDTILGELDAHPNIDVRLYNPFTTRRFKNLGFLLDFRRLNRRMHNKSLIIDQVAAICGGRNIGDEYFGTGLQPTYVDLDVVATGAVVADLAADFARYWDSRSSYAIADLVRPMAPTTSTLDAQLKTATKDPRFAEYQQRIATTDLAAKLSEGSLPLEWCVTKLVSDPPEKTLGQARRDALMVGQIDPLMGSIRQSLDVVSAYFVPGKRGTSQLVALAKSGARVRVLTNSMEANGVMLVHSGYIKYRRKLIEGGVELFELKAAYAAGLRHPVGAGSMGSSAASLHAKCFAVDGRCLYVGSFNFDPRSVKLNTEMGLLVESHALAADMSLQFDREIERTAYRVTLAPGGRLQWIDPTAPKDGAKLRVDPNTSWSQRALVKAVGLLPIQWLL